MDLGTKRALKIKNVAALSIKVGGSLASSTKTSQKRKNQSDEDRPLKTRANQPVNLGRSGSQGTPNPPRHGVGKGLMTAHGPIINEPIPPPCSAGERQAACSPDDVLHRQESQS